MKELEVPQSLEELEARQMFEEPKSPKKEKDLQAR